VRRLEHENIELLSEVLVGNVADSLADYSEINEFDLILIATHGRTGVSRWVRGSIADKVLRSSHIPVLMVRAPGSEGGI
jgi:nucleotide-binding universal stress UspA family protein